MADEDQGQQLQSFPGGAVAPAGEPKQQESDQGKTFTQDEVNKIIADRVARAKPADYSDLKAKAAEYDKLAEKSQTETERLVNAARKETEQSVVQKFNRRIVQSEARALAASAKFRDPSDAVAFLGDLSQIQVTDDGVDVKALNSALADLAKQKPYLLIDEKPTRPEGDVGQGPRGNSGPANMNSLLHGLAKRGS
jgi:hypothetical protein